MMSTALFITVLALSQTPGWTWTLYDGTDAIVLANERPDTPDLRATLECAKGTGIARVSLYRSALQVGYVTVSSGDQTAAAEAALGPDQGLVASLRTDHPVFGNFSRTGDLSFAVAQARHDIQIGAGDLAKLRRFADLCGG